MKELDQTYTSHRIKTNHSYVWTADNLFGKSKAFLFTQCLCNGP